MSLFSAKTCKTFLFLMLLGLTNISLLAAGKVYLVLGSDTAIWDGMAVGRYNCYYHRGLYTDPARNGAAVMDPAFREGLRDSYGTPMKLTWWMMCGSIFQPGANTNVPYPNVMTMYLMKTYYGEQITRFGDELSLHYHTFKWSDYDGDGVFWWNQALSFQECRDDFDLTLAQLLIEEEVFPVSFRSGWHYMDNEWQHYLDELLPYSLHNDWPNERVDTEEPLDNTFDWSRAPGQFVPYRPSPQNYQLPGDGPGWNVRSAHLFRARYRDLVDSLFARAAAGVDQLACLWGHLPEEDFLTNLETIDSLAHRMATKYPGVKFRYCTAIEAMQRWRGTSDTRAPALIFEALESGEEVRFRIATNEPIFQRQPFVALKTVYEQYRILPCQPTGPNRWETREPVARRFAARAAVALCDTLGNQATAFIDFRPRDVYLDNEMAGYTEVRGNWQSLPGDEWGIDYRQALVSPGDSTITRWYPRLAEEALYNIEIRLPPVSDPIDTLTFTLYQAGQPLDTTGFRSVPLAGQWQYLGTARLRPEEEPYLEMLAHNDSEVALTVGADVVKFSALVRERDIRPLVNFLDLGEIVERDSAFYPLTISNRGIQPLTVTSLTSITGIAGTTHPLPVVIPPMGERSFEIFIFPPGTGLLSDTLLIVSDDPVKPQLRIPLAAEALPYFTVADNEDSSKYAETGTWHYSNAEAFGPSSRYAFLNQHAAATFTITLKEAGLYEIFEIVPRTENAANRALYRISLAGTLLDTLFVDQNDGSGDWVSLGRYQLPANRPVEVEVLDTGASTAGAVLRADAIKVALVPEITELVEASPDGLPKAFALEPNYPNPFNPTTTFRYALAKGVQVKLTIYNILGQPVATLVDERQNAGKYEARWNAASFASGLYIVHLQAGSVRKSRKIMLLK